MSADHDPAHTVPHRTPGGGSVTDCDDDTSCKRVACEVCLNELPPDAVNTSDAQDYVHHFCSLGCLEQWQKQSASRPAGTPEKSPDRIK